MQQTAKKYDDYDEFGPVWTSKPADREAVIAAVKNGHHTLAQIARATNLNPDTVQFELNALEGIEISSKPAPPVKTYWEKGKAPEGRVYLSGGTVGVIDEPKPAKPAGKMKSPVKAPIPQIPPVAAAVHAAAAATVLPALSPVAATAAAAAEVGTADEFRAIPVESIIPNPDNPRHFVDTEEQQFLDLVESIRAKGIQEPLIVTPDGGGGVGTYRNVMGHRRHAAALRAGLRTVPCIVRRFKTPADEFDAMLIENIQRKDLTPIQEAKAFKKVYLKTAGDIHAVARKIGLTQSYILARLALLKLDLGIQIMVERGELNVTTAREISALTHAQQRKILPRALRMKSADLKELVAKTKNLEGGAKIYGKPKRERNRVTTDEEKFARSGALRELERLGEAWFSSRFLKESFDDVCIDACLEAKDESICHGCPLPRFIESIVRRTTRKEQQQQQQQQKHD